MSEVKVRETDTIDITEDRLWEILSDDFIKVASWASTVEHYEANSTPQARLGDAPVGDRYCQVPGFGLTEE